MNLKLYLYNLLGEMALFIGAIIFLVGVLIYDSNLQAIIGIIIVILGFYMQFDFKRKFDKNGGLIFKKAELKGANFLIGVKKCQQ